MKILVKRKWQVGDTTTGEMWVDDVFFCYTLEDKIREIKIKHKTAIPEGVYKLVLSVSNRFKKILPEILNVSNFTGIRIHAGNTHIDTSGCILIGEILTKDKTKLINSRQAMNKLMSLLQKQNNITIEIKNDFKQVD
jgi:hypothetical protein